MLLLLLVCLISEKEELKKMVEGLVWYRPRKEELARYGSGGVAIIDQWIASHAQYFIGKTLLTLWPAACWLLPMFRH